MMGTETLEKAVILYFEDDFRDIAKRYLEAAFPEYQIGVHDGGKRHGNVKAIIDEVIQQFFSLSSVAMVCTDGNLAGFITGWDVVEELNSRGYNGPAIYTGGHQLPIEKAHLYVSQTSKFGDDLVHAIRESLQER